MNNKKYYLVLFLVLGLTLLLFGLSYAKNTGVVNEPVLIKEDIDGISVTYSKSNYLNLQENQEIDLVLINTNSLNTSYEIVVEEENGRSYDDVYYQINDSVSTKLESKVLTTGILKKIGNKGDIEKVNIKIWSLSKINYKFKITVKMLKNSDLDYIIKNDNLVYKDGNDYRYYGLTVNNYIKYKNQLYRIIGLIDNKYKLISLNSYSGSYKESDASYLSIEDYLKSINDVNVNLDNVFDYDSWLNDENGFWLEDIINDSNAYYLKDKSIEVRGKGDILNAKEVIWLDEKLEVLKGNGTLETPFEVSYGE